MFLGFSPPSIPPSFSPIFPPFSTPKRGQKCGTIFRPFSAFQGVFVCGRQSGDGVPGDNPGDKSSKTPYFPRFPHFVPQIVPQFVPRKRALTPQVLLPFGCRRLPPSPTLSPEKSLFDPYFFLPAPSSPSLTAPPTPPPVPRHSFSSQLHQTQIDSPLSPSSPAQGSEGGVAPAVFSVTS